METKKKTKLLVIIASGMTVIMAAVSVLYFFVPKKEKTVTKNIVEATDTVLFEDGASDFCIVVPDIAGEYETIAASELQEFFRETTGFLLPVVSDKGVSFSPDKNHLSVGATKLFRASGVTVSYDELGNSGFKIVSFDRTIILAGAEGKGTLYAVYEFLKYQFGFKVYSYDEIAITKSQTAYLNRYEVTSVPDFNNRMVGYYELNNDAIWRRRMRLVGYYDDSWALQGHTSFQIIPPGTYGAHKDWFSSDGTQLCYTNENMKAEFIKNVLNIINTKPQSDKVMLTLQDNANFCDCDECKASRQKYGTNSATLILFLNDVAEAVLERLGGRNITFYTLAYLSTIDAPATYKESKRAYEPTVTAHPNVGVIYAPMLSDFRYPFNSAKNSGVRAALNAWSTVTSNLTIYSYSEYVHNVFIPFNIYSIIQQNYQWAKEIGVANYYEQAFLVSDIGAFSRLNIFLMSQLMWDSSQNVEALVKDFMNNYYGSAGTALKRYYDLYRMWFENIQTKTATGSIYDSIGSPENFPKYLLESWQACFDEAYESIEYLKAEPLLYIKYFDRIKRENLTVDYLLLNYHYEYYSKSELAKKIDEFEYYTNRYDFTSYGENVAEKTETLISAWRENAR